MNFVGPRFRLVFLGAALLASAHAQLVHIAFTEGKYNNMVFRATSPQIPWDHTGGYISRFDLWYDASAPLDPARNLWRARVYAYGLGTFEIVRPNENLSFADDNLTLIHSVSTGVYEALDLTTVISNNVPSDPGLPVPPFSLNNYSLFLAGGQSYFDVPDLAEGYGYGNFSRVTARVVDSVDLHPVPEPSTYALGASVLLGSAVVVTKFRRRRAAGQTPRALP